MSLDYRTRNIVIAAVLAAAAVLLTVVYVSSARKHDTTQAQTVTVYTSTQSYPQGTAGTKIVGHLKAQKVTRAIQAPKAVTSPEQIRALYTTEPIYAGEQLSLKRFAPPAEQGIRPKLSGDLRAFQVSGDTNQLLAGTLVPGDHVDVVVNVKNPANANDIKTLVALRNLLVLQTDKGKGGAKIDRGQVDDHAVILAVTDEQSQRLFNVMQNGAWSLLLRPVKKPADSARSVATFATVVNGGSK